MSAETDRLHSTFARAQVAENGDTLVLGGQNRRRARCSRAILCAVCVCLLLALLCIGLIGALAYLLYGPSENVCLSTGCIRTAATILDAMDDSVNPCDDFYQFACGNWIRSHPIPDDSSSVSSFENLSKDLETALNKLLLEAHGDADGSAVHKAKQFYSMCLNETSIRHSWRGAFDTVMSEAGGWPTLTAGWKADLTVEQLYGRLVARFRSNSLFKCTVQADDKNSAAHVLLIDQPELILLAREFYLLSETREEREAYTQLMHEVLLLLGADSDTARGDSADVLRFETQLANISVPEDERHDISKLYNKVTLSELQSRLAAFDWYEFLSEVYKDIPEKETGKPPVFTADTQLVVYGITYFDKLNELLRSTKRRTISNYMAWCWFFKTMLRELPDPFAMTLFKFYRTLNRTPRVLAAEQRGRAVMQVPKLRWHNCVARINGLMAMATSRLYVKRYFNQSAKERVEQMIAMIMDAFHDLLDAEPWLTPETQAVAREKLELMAKKIGYPEFLNEPDQIDEMYSRFKVVHADYYGTKFQFYEMYQRDVMERIREPVDRERWVAGAAVVNAFYSPNTNEIIFPAGILQPVFYSESFPWSMNFGGIGVVIGHEITHGFDDRGRLYDSYGNIVQWWDNGTIRKFEEKARCIEDQYSSYVLEQVNMRINGKNTKGENIADNGGLKQAYRAYKKWAAENAPEPNLPGIKLTHDQLFFLNYAQIWCGSMNDKEAMRKLRTSEHCPGEIRVKGPLSNSHDFAEVFDCPTGSPMNPPENQKCRVW